MTSAAKGQVELAAGPLHYTECGSGPPVVLVHGLFVNGSLWDRVVPLLAEHCRVLVLEMPLGSHPEPMRPEADLSPPGLARLIVDFLAALNLTDVTLVGNDTGGALCQLAAAQDPERLGRLVLTNCDAYENFLPRVFRYLQWLSHLPGGVWSIGQTLRVPALRRLPIALGGLSTRPAPRKIEDGWCTPVRRSPGVRHDVTKVLRGIAPRYTVAVIERLRQLDLPVLLAWGREDPFFRLDFARRLARDIPRAQLEPIPGSRTFVPLDAPVRLAELIMTFAVTAG